jgi:hypothetical protein
MILAGVYGLAPPDMELTVPHTHQVFFTEMPENSANISNAAATMESKQEDASKSRPDSLIQSQGAANAAIVVPYEERLAIESTPL